MTNYEVKIIESSKELTKREKVRFKDYNQFPTLPELLSEAPDFCFEPDFDVVLSVHNEKVKEGQKQDYEIYLFVTKTGDAFYTGSASFFDSYKDIISEMQGETDFMLGCKKIQSKNYTGSFYKAILL